MLNYVTFSEKHGVARRIWRLTKRFLVCPLSAPLYSLCTALDAPPKWLSASPTGSVKWFWNCTALLLSEYFLTFSQSFAEMTTPKVAGRDMPPRKIRAKNFSKNTKAIYPPKMDNEGKKPSTSKRTNPRDPTIPSWSRGFFTAIHSFLAAHDLDNLSKSAAAESSEEAPETIIKFQADTSSTNVLIEWRDCIYRIPLYLPLCLYFTFWIHYYLHLRKNYF